MRVKVENGLIMFKPTKATRGADVFQISERTRGGTGITINGKFADQFLKETGLERGSHMKLSAAQYGWMVAEPMEAPGVKPSKIVACARLWRAVDELGEKAEVAPARKQRAAKVAKPAKAATAPAQASRRGRKSNAQKAAEAAAAAAPKRGRKSNAQKAAEAQAAAA
jgi:hypothetical protein